MSLNRDQLQSDLLAAFQAASQSKKPEDAQTVLAQKIADAVNAYVGGADVKGVQVDISAGSPAPQTGKGWLE
jgi:hypothetical protein